MSHMKNFIIPSIASIFISTAAYCVLPDISPVWRLLDDKKPAEANQELYNIFFSERCYLPECPDYGYYYLMRAFIFEIMNEKENAQYNINMAIQSMQACD
jgi:hypothetical protein